MPSEEERWQEFLRQDTDSAEEVESLIPTLQRLRSWDAPAVTPQDTARLLSVLIPAMPSVAETRKTPAKGKLWPLLLLQSQLKVVRGEIWLATAVILALGVLVTLTLPASGGSESTLPLALVAPLLTALGVSFLYGPEVDPALEVELATPVSQRLLLLARLCLLFGFNLGLGLAGSILVAAAIPGVSPWALILAWLVPMCFLSALAFLLAVLFTDPMVGILVSLAIWTGQCIERFTTQNSLSLPFSLPDLASDVARPWLLGLTVVSIGVAMWLADKVSGRFQHSNDF